MEYLGEWERQFSTAQETHFLPCPHPLLTHPPKHWLLLRLYEGDEN